VRNGNIGSRVDVAGYWIVREETTGVGGTLLEVQRQLVRLRAVLCGEGRQELGLQAIGKRVLELDLGVDDVGGGEGLGDGDAYRFTTYCLVQQDHEWNVYFLNLGCKC
jgi:hypothetical protein